MKKRIGLLTALVMVMAVFMLGKMSVTSYASEQTTGSFKSATENVTAYESKSTSSKSITIRSGEMVYLSSEDSDWFEIMYQGETYYVENTGAVFTDYINEAVGEDLEKRSQTDKAWIESYVSQMNAQRNARIWRIVIIAVIVVAIGVIIFRSIHQKNNAAEAEKSN